MSPEELASKVETKFGESNRLESELLRIIDLERWRKKVVATLSGGMKHRVSLACSLIHEPELLFLDEPTVGVDPELRAYFWKYFHTLREKGKTIVMTTHYMDEAINCTKIGFIRQGRLIAEGKPQKLISQTNTKSLEEAFLTLAKEKDRK